MDGFMKAMRLVCTTLEAELRERKTHYMNMSLLHGRAMEGSCKELSNTSWRPRLLDVVSTESAYGVLDLRCSSAVKTAFSPGHLPRCHLAVTTYSGAHTRRDIRPLGSQVSRSHDKPEMVGSAPLWTMLEIDLHLGNTNNRPTEAGRLEDLREARLATSSVCQLVSRASGRRAHGSRWEGNRRKYFDLRKGGKDGTA